MTRYYYIEKKKVAYTITELMGVLIMLVIVGTIAFIQASSISKKHSTISKIQSTYDLLEKSAILWQTENNCSDSIQKCVKNARDNGIANKEIFNGIAKYLPVTAANVNLNAKSRDVHAEKVPEVDWLPYYTMTFDGNPQTSSSFGVSKYNDADTINLSFYKLRDGTTIMVNLSDYSTNTGFGFFDIDGKDGENKIGVDVYPFSLGADISLDNKLYNEAANKFNPYFSSNKYNLFDLCNINRDSCENEKSSVNPTIYVLKRNRLPR